MTNSQRNPSSVVPFVYQHTVTMDTGATGLSASIDLGDLTLVAIQTSTDWTNAAITFEASYDDTTFVHMYEFDGTELTATVTDTDEACFIQVEPTHFAGVRYLKLRSGILATPVAQDAARTLYAYTRRV